VQYWISVQFLIATLAEQLDIPWVSSGPSSVTAAPCLASLSAF
jgi:hypothetical protein